MKSVGLIGIILAGTVLGGCSGSPSSAPTERASTPGAKAAPQLVALLPARGQVAGWAPLREPRGFTSENLWEEIDGAADRFITYGVQHAVFADFRQAATGEEAVVEIYQMADALNAFGKYADERSPDYTFVQVGAEGYAAANVVNFWAGQYYVKVRGFADTEAVRQELMKLAESVAAKVKIPGREPRELAFFPAKDQVARSARYIPRDVLAQSYLANAFQVEYKTGQKASALVLISLDSPDAALDALNRYRDAVAQGGQNIRVITAPGDGGFAGQDSFYGNLAAVRVGNHIAVALGTATEDAGKAQLTELIRTIK